VNLYNTLTRSIEPLTPLAPPAVTIYVCGPTVYDDPHIGHARSAFIFDVLRRALASRQFQVRFVRNVTDVDDKIIERARQETGDKRRETGDLRAACRQVAERYLASYHAAMDRLGIQRPDVEPRATERVVPDMTDCIATLLIAGAAYEAQGDVYFSVRKFERYGRLSNRSLDELQAGARVEPGEHKQDPLDFALWKAAKPGEPSWPSPWGDGRPGWHIECSTMSTKELGDAFDIHGGGVDLVFPHHENEIAQAQAVGKPFARLWVHNGLLTVQGQKMSKSLGNYLTLEQVLEAYPHPDYLKLFFLKTHYRSPIDYSPERMAEAKKNYEEFSWFLQHCDQLTVRANPGAELAMRSLDYPRMFQNAMEEDLNTPKALAVLFELVRRGREGLEQGTVEGSAIATSCFLDLLELGMRLGLFTQGVGIQVPPDVKALIDEREAARRAKDFAKADAVRQKVNAMGYLLTDTPHGTLCRRA